MITYKKDPNFYLFLDDERHPNGVFWVDLPKNVPWIIVRNYKQFKSAIETRGIPAFVTFDHDLADEHYSMTSDEVSNSSYEEVVNSYRERTGYDCLKWFITKVLAPIGAPFPDYALHTMNSIGKYNMENYINNYKRYLLSDK